MAAILKYDQEIPEIRSKKEGITKGYYLSEKELVEKIKKNISGYGAVEDSNFKTIECQLMDIADDIAYSTYDLEDALKAGFLTPIGILSESTKVLNKVSSKIRSKTKFTEFSTEDVIHELTGIFLDDTLPFDEIKDDVDIFNSIVKYNRLSSRVASDGYLKTSLTSSLVGEFINGVKIDLNEDYPVSSSIYLADKVLKKVELLKHYTYESLVMSAQLKLSEYRGYEIIKTIFDALSDDSSTFRKGTLLMPDDVKEIYESFQSEGCKKTCYL